MPREVKMGTIDYREPLTFLEGINPMQIGMIGLGRMGANMVRRLIKSGHECVVFDRSQKLVQELVCESAVGASDLRDIIEKLAAPRAVWLMVPAAAVDETVADLVPLLEAGDTIDRWWQFLLRRRHPASEGTRGEGNPLRRCGNKRRGMGARARLLHDDWRRNGGHGTPRPDFPNTRTRRGRHCANTGSRQISAEPPRWDICIAVQTAPAISSRWCTTESSTA